MLETRSADGDGAKSSSVFAGGRGGLGGSGKRDRDKRRT